MSKYIRYLYGKSIIMIHILELYFLVNCMGLATVMHVWWQIEISWKLVTVTSFHRLALSDINRYVSTERKKCIHSQKIGKGDLFTLTHSKKSEKNMTNCTVLV